MSIDTKLKNITLPLAMNNVLLKYVDITDCKNVHSLRTNAEVGKYLIRSLDKSLDEIQQFVEDRMISDHFFTINTIDTNKFAGTIALWRINLENEYAELGYEMLPEFQGKGLMNNAIQLVLKHAVTLNINHIEAKTHRDNLKSRQLLERNGFTFLPSVIDENNTNNVVYEYRNTNNKT